MNHELVMLRGINYCKKSAHELDDLCKSVAMKSYSTFKWRDGTWGQLQKLSEYVSERDKYLSYMAFLRQALLDTPRGYRALIVAVYVKRIPKEELCRRYNVSMSTVYRKLSKARQSFRSKLELLGCSEKWFTETFSAVSWVNAMLQNPHNGSRICE